MTEVEAQGRRVEVAEIHLPGTPRGGVVVLCDTRQLPDLMNGLAEHGYESLGVWVRRQEVDDEGAAALLDVLLLRMEKRQWSAEQTGLIGDGVGARAALLAASGRQLGAAVSLSPTGLSEETPMGPALADLAISARTPWLGMFGQHDPHSPGPAVARLRKQLADSSPAFTEVVTYPGVNERLETGSNARLAEAATYDAWQRTVEWLNLRVAPRPSVLAVEWSNKA